MADSTREIVLQAVLDKLWSSVHEFSEHDINACGNPTGLARERWQAYAEHILIRWLEYHSPSAADRTVAAKRERGGKFDWSGESVELEANRGE